VPKKIIYAKACIEARLVKEGEVTKQTIYILIAQTAACRKPRCRNVLKGALIGQVAIGSLID